MDLYLTIAMILANVIALGIVYQFIKKLPRKEIIIFMAISVALVYVTISITYWISGFGVEEKVHEVAKNFVTYLFVPVNVILFIPYIASQYRKIRLNQIEADELKRKSGIIALLFIVVIVVEYFYFCNIQKNINNIKDEANTTVQEDNIMKNETRENKVAPNLATNEIQNEISNQISNETIIKRENTVTINEIENQIQTELNIIEEEKKNNIVATNER